MTFKIAIVGAGKVAKNNYVPYLAERGDVALGYFSRTRAKADALASEYGGVSFATPAELAAWAPDAYFVLTHETQRHAATDALLDFAPKRIFWEKPLRRPRRPGRGKRTRLSRRPSTLCADAGAGRRDGHDLQLSLF